MKVKIALIATDLGYKKFMESIVMDNNHTVEFIHVTEDTESIRGVEFNAFLMHGSAVLISEKNLLVIVGLLLSRIRP